MILFMKTAEDKFVPVCVCVTPPLVVLIPSKYPNVSVIVTDETKHLLGMPISIIYLFGFDEHTKLCDSK